MNRALILFVALVAAAGCSSADTTHETSLEAGGGADTSTGTKDSVAPTDGGADAQAADAPQEAPSDDVEDLGKRKDGAATDAGDGSVALSGKLKWAEGFGTTGNTTGLSIAADASGNVFASGWTTGTVDFGGGALTCPAPDGASAVCAFLAKFDSSGSYVWAKMFSSSANQVIGAVVRTDSAANVYLIGHFWGDANLGAGKLKSSAKRGAIFVAKYDTTGAYQWARAFANATNKSYDVASGRVDSGGNIVFAGQLSGSLDFGGGDLVATGLYLVKLDTTGAYQWGDTFNAGSKGDAQPLDLALDPSGNIVLGGQFFTSIELGGGELKAAGTAQNAFVAKYTASGSYTWAHVFQDGLGDYTTGVGTDPSGDVLVTGTFAGSVNLGSGVLTSAGGTDVFLGKMDPSGNGIWSEHFGDANDQLGGQMAVSGSGASTILGSCYTGSIDFGGGAILCENTGFVATLDATGAYAWAYTGGSTEGGGLGVNIDATDSVLLAGDFVGKFRLAGSILTAPVGTIADGVVAKFSP